MTEFVFERPAPDAATVERIAGEMLAQIRNMQANGIVFADGSTRELPDVRSFSELHDYFDANVGWGTEFDEIGYPGWNMLTDRVDAMLKDRD